MQTSQSNEAARALCTLLKPAHLAAPFLPPQGSNFDTSEQPTQYESSIERPITSIFTGAPVYRIRLVRLVRLVCRIRLEWLVAVIWPSALAPHHLALHFRYSANLIPGRQLCSGQEGGGLSVHHDRGLVPGLQRSAVPGVEERDRL